MDILPAVRFSHSVSAVESMPRNQVASRHWSTNAGALAECARRYLEAAGQISDAEHLLHPRCYLFGTSMELALKSFIARRGAVYPRGHDLVALLEVAVKLELQVTDLLRTNVVPALNEIYLEHDNYGFFAARYAAEDLARRTQAWKTPAPERLDTAIRYILSQAEAQSIPR
jgi:HEPN domain-containing protein